jgi:hypothetical protein
VHLLVKRILISHLLFKIHFSIIPLSYELGCTISLKAAVLPGHQLTGPSEEEEEEESLYLRFVLCRLLKVGK